MNFLSPTAIAWAAALSVPPLVALYFLKLKRQVHEVPSTLLWRKAIEDLRVNAPFQRLRNSLLLWLQLLVLIAAAVALGKPMFQTVETYRDTVILLIDQSASMNVVEASGQTRLDLAKAQAKSFVDNLADDARAMVIAYCDRATVVSTFDTDKSALKRKIEAIAPTDSRSALTEAITLAEAYTQNIVIGLEGQDEITMTSDAQRPATVALFSDGRIEDADQVIVQSFDIARMKVFNVGQRADNVGILAMDARRDYEIPELLEVSATVRNFGSEPQTFDAVLYVDGANVDVKSVTVPGLVDDSPDARRKATVSLVFDAIEFAGNGVIEVMLRITDALDADNRAWTQIDRPRDLSLLLVTRFNPMLSDMLTVLDIPFIQMTPEEYEAADEADLTDGVRSNFDVVIIDGHSTDRLPVGNYFFWGGAPLIDGVTIGEPVRNQIVFNWDDTHPLLRYTAVENLRISSWLSMTLPERAESIIEGATSPILSVFTDGESRYLLSAFSLVTYDNGVPSENGNFNKLPDFVPFIQNAIQYLAGSVAIDDSRAVRPGEPVMMPIESDVETVTVERPDRREDAVPTGGFTTLHYADTRKVGPYRVTPGIEGRDRFAVNLFNATESHVAPAEELVLGGTEAAMQGGSVEVSQPAWPYVLLAMLVFLAIEWLVYSRRVMV